MIHRMKINDNAFDRMKRGIKKREYRVNDEKRQLVRCDDVICFENLSNEKETVLMDVNGIEKFATLEEAVSSHFDEDFGKRYADVKSAVESFYQKGYYTKEEVEKNGMVIFEIKNTELLT